MTFYNYRQNNSGGAWAKPAMVLIVEADTREEADEIAESHGVYFNGVAEDMDCSCCGDRWDGATEESGYEPCEPDALYDSWSKSSGVPRELVIRRAGG